MRFYLTNGYSKDYKYIAAQFFGFDSVKKVIKDKEVSMEVNNG